MCNTNYIAPEITLFNIAIEHGFGTSQGSSNVNIGIGGWEVENDEFNVK